MITGVSYGLILCKIFELVIITYIIICNNDYK